MPTYDYECTHCKHTFEVFQQMSDKLLEKCPKCDKKLKRLIAGGAGIIFKGSGFYATDYRKGSHKPKADKAASCPKVNGACGSCPHA